VIYNTDTTTYDGYFGGLGPAWDSFLTQGGSGSFSRVILAAGTAAAPSLTFTQDLTSGIYQSAPGTVNVSVLGNPAAQFSATGLTLSGQSGNPGSIFFNTETNAKYVQLEAPLNANLPSSLAFTLPNNVPTVNNTPLVSNGAGVMSFNSSGFISASGAVTSAQLLAMYNTPLEILTPVAGMAYLIHRFSFETLTGTAYAGGGNIFLQYGSTPHGAGTKATDNIGGGLMSIAGGTNYLANVAGLENQGVVTAVLVANGLYLTNDTASFTGGSFGANVNVWYSLIPLS
jgi:hypothetical protein